MRARFRARGWVRGILYVKEYEDPSGQYLFIGHKYKRNQIRIPLRVTGTDAEGFSLVKVKPFGMIIWKGTEIQLPEKLRTENKLRAKEIEDTSERYLLVKENKKVAPIEKIPLPNPVPPKKEEDSEPAPIIPPSNP